MSRMAVALTFAFAPAAAWGQPISDREALELHPGDIVKPIALTGCPTSTDPDEIVVCGVRSPDPPRLSANGDVRLSGDPLPGEAPTGMAAMGAGACISRCPQPLRLDIVKAVGSVSAAIGRLLDDE